MSSDYEFSDDDGEYYDDDEMLDGTQEEGWLFLTFLLCRLRHY